MGKHINMKKIRGLVFILAVVMMFSTLGSTKEVEAASKYIKVVDYIKYIVDEMDWQVDDNTDSAYIDIAMDKCILKEGDFKDYSAYLTRTDAAVIANRLDELVHLKYGYPEEVYSFLKDCTLHENTLFYTTDGSLYPKGATRETYPEGIFHEDVVMPILGEYFKDDNWKDKGLRSGYWYITDGEANILKRYIEVGVKPTEKLNFVGIEPFDDDAEILKAWNLVHDGERKLNAVLEDRISDIKDIPKSKREDVASIVAKGIIKGYSNGMYVLNREFRGDKKITAKGAKNVIQMVLNPNTRAKVSPDGQLIRTKNLPKNSSDYSYILESFPNKYYEMNYSFMYLTDYLSGKIRDDEYAYPREANYEFLYDKYYHNKMKLELGKYGYYDQTLSYTEKYLKHIFDVDYRTVNDKWKEGLASSLSFYSWEEDVYDRIDSYVDNIKKNHVVVELDKIAIDPGAMYESRGYVYVRAYVKYRVTADDISVPSSQLIFDSNIKNIKNGEWREEIFDVFVEYRSEKGIYKFAPSAFVTLDDWQYIDSFE